MTFLEYRKSIYHRYPITFGYDKPTEGSDIVFHLPVIEYYAYKCKHVTEFGVREGHSTFALLSGCKGIVNSYDIERTPVCDFLERADLPCKWKFFQADTGSSDLKIEETELLMFDTLHTYEHLIKELSYHAEKSSRYLLFHDTETCGIIDKSGSKKEGILKAITEFVDNSRFMYEEVYRTNENNGFLILERK